MVLLQKLLEQQPLQLGAVHPQFNKQQMLPALTK
jgi:hypothetical protein